MPALPRQLGERVPGRAAGQQVIGGYYVQVGFVSAHSTGLFTSAGLSSIKARYVDGLGNKVGALVSESITPMVVPEPALPVLLALGLLCGARRRG